MIFLDTNVLVYATVCQDKKKQEKADSIIRGNIQENLILSPLVLSEFIYVVNKLELDKDYIHESVSVFNKCSKHHIDTDMVNSAFELSRMLNMGKSINDLIHLKFAEKYSSRIITFDDNFKKLKRYTDLAIEILK